MDRALTFYKIDYNTWQETYLKNNSSNRFDYEEWFFATAQKFDFPEDIYNKIILNYPPIHNAITLSTITESIHIFQRINTETLVYFPFPAGEILFHLANIRGTKNNSQEFKEFKKFLVEIDKKKIYVVAEYNKQLGWFDYEEFLKNKKLHNAQNFRQYK